MLGGKAHKMLPREQGRFKVGQRSVQQPCALQMEGSGEEAEMGRDSGVSQLLHTNCWDANGKHPKEKVIVPVSPLQAEKKELLFQDLKWIQALNFLPSLKHWRAQLPWGLSGILGGADLHFRGTHIFKANFAVCYVFPLEKTSVTHLNKIPGESHCVF